MNCRAMNPPTLAAPGCRPYNHGEPASTGQDWPPIMVMVVTPSPMNIAAFTPVKSQKLRSTTRVCSAARLADGASGREESAPNAKAHSTRTAIKLFNLPSLRATEGLNELQGWLATTFATAALKSASLEHSGRWKTHCLHPNRLWPRSKTFLAGQCRKACINITQLLVFAEHL
jgi:hypothetical protein